eukprot:scaffold130803_cov25-Tisochrysis_lutea.AAC.1
MLAVARRAGRPLRLPPALAAARVGVGRALLSSTAEAIDSRPWPLRWWKSLVFWSAVSTWAFSLMQQNRSRRALEQREDEVRDGAPVNADEILELRALNDVSTEQMAKLPDVSRAVCRHKEATLPEIVAALTQTIGKPIQEECAVERMLLALQCECQNVTAEADDMPIAAPPSIPICQAAAALAFMSNGPVNERLDSLFIACSDGGATVADGEIEGRISAEKFVRTLGVLTATGQVPPEKQVALDDIGADSLGIDRSWYLQQPAIKYSAAELADAAVTELAREGLPAPPSWYQFWRWGEKGAVADAARAADEEGKSGLPDQLDRAYFGRLLVSDAICLWGECHLIAERKRIQRRKEEALKAESSPPAWQFWKWGSSNQKDEAV